MLKDFFKLNGHYQTFKTDEEFLDKLRHGNLRDALYEPSDLGPAQPYKTLKIKEKKINNVSFSKTKLYRIVFIDCSFEDCLFIGTEIENCEFHNCKFINCNTHKIKISKTYINPNNFSKCFNKIGQANIAVHLYHQLINNLTDEVQSDFRRIAVYNFYKWKDKLSLNKFWNGKPDKISLFVFLKQYPLSWLYRYTFGYGLRLRNFIFSFLAVFLLFFVLNCVFWQEYGLTTNNSLPVNVFDKDSVSTSSNFYYTLDAATKLVDSPFQVTTDFGIILLIIQSFVGFIFLSALIAIIINRFVK